MKVAVVFALLVVVAWGWFGRHDIRVPRPNADDIEWVEEEDLG